MIHVRAVSPTDTTPTLDATLAANPGVLNLIVMYGVARNPDGDAVEFDVIAADADEVLRGTRTLGVVERGSLYHRGRRRRAGPIGPARANDPHAPRALQLMPTWEAPGGQDPRQGGQ